MRVIYVGRGCIRFWNILDINFICNNSSQMYKKIIRNFELLLSIWIISFRNKSTPEMRHGFTFVRLYVNGSGLVLYEIICRFWNNSKKYVSKQKIDISRFLHNIKYIYICIDLVSNFIMSVFGAFTIKYTFWNFFFG